ncbi:MAG: DUF222 domain-containing protein [Actinomycetota bacterium]
MNSLAGVHETVKAVDPSPLSRRELYGLIGDLEKLRSRVDERLMAAKAALDSLGDTGADSAVVGRSVGRRSERQARRDRTTARGLAEMPTLADGLAEGRLNVEHAAIVAEAAEQTSPELAAALVPLAESVPADLFAKKAREFVGRHTTATETEARHRRQRAQRAGWHRVHHDGSVEIHGRFDEATGAVVLADWKRRTDHLWNADGGRDGAPDDVRTQAQRRADALAELITEPHTAGEGSAAVDGPIHPRFQVHVVVNLTDGTITWLDGSPVPDTVLERIGPTADMVGHVFSGDGQPLWQGRTKRLATTAQWRSLIVATRGCAECGADIDRCHAHYVLEWIDDNGPTDIDNLQLLCHTCHGHAHRGSRGDPRHHRQPRAA